MTTSASTPAIVESLISAHDERRSRAEASPRYVGRPPAKPRPVSPRACCITLRMPAPSPSPGVSDGSAEPGTSSALSGPSSTTSALLPLKMNVGMAPTRPAICPSAATPRAQRIVPWTTRRPRPSTMSAHSLGEYASTSCQTPTSTRAGSALMGGSTSAAYSSLIASASSGSSRGLFAAALPRPKRRVLSARAMASGSAPSALTTASVSWRSMGAPPPASKQHSSVAFGAPAAEAPLLAARMARPPFPLRTNRTRVFRSISSKTLETLCSRTLSTLRTRTRPCGHSGVAAAWRTRPRATKARRIMRTACGPPGGAAGG
mmetsp:Transcript_50261/g.132863  ORF Transcript_50261/g.132863 Transcript_50261/m.132863 type:complete len:318 (+) Transcript_50261:428-1381(+)